jgi:hypothetical protein
MKHRTVEELATSVLRVLSAAEKEDIVITGLEAWVTDFKITGIGSIFGIPILLHWDDPFSFSPIGDWIC